MGEHRHLEHSGSGLLAAAQASFCEAGEQWTDMRSDVFEVLAACERHNPDGRMALIGIAVGAEVLCRLSLVVPKAVRKSGPRFPL